MSTLPESAASQTPLATPRDRSESPTSNAVITPITQPDSTKNTACDLARRLQVVFQDLGLLPHIPSDWLQPSPDGLSFRSLSVREASQFVRAVEEVAHGHEAPPSVSPDQLSLF